MLDDALEMGYKFPERQLQNPIIFLGEETVWEDPADGDRYVTVLGGWTIGRGGRWLELDGFDNVWYSRCRFSAVREELHPKP